MYQREKYPKNWPELSQACKDKAGWKCQYCGVEHRAIRISHKTGVVYPVFLHAAHKYLNDEGNPAPELLCLCPTCHGVRDALLRRSAADLRLERMKHIRLIAIRYTRAAYSTPLPV
jgi:hypothetical protein